MEEKKTFFKTRLLREGPGHTRREVDVSPNILGKDLKKKKGSNLSTFSRKEENYYLSHMKNIHIKTGELYFFFLKMFLYQFCFCNFGSPQRFECQIQPRDSFLLYEVCGKGIVFIESQSDP